MNKIGLNHLTFVDDVPCSAYSRRGHSKNCWQRCHKSKKPRSWTGSWQQSAAAAALSPQSPVMLGQYLKFLFGDDSTTHELSRPYTSPWLRGFRKFSLFLTSRIIFAMMLKASVSFIREWALGMSCVCCSGAAEAAVSKEDAPEQIGWTRTACRWHSTVTQKACLGHS